MPSADPETRDHLRRVREQLVDPTVRHAAYPKFLGFLARNEDDPHYLRLAYTWGGVCNWLGDLVDDKNIRICETGELSLISHFLREEGYSVEETLSDLRYPVAVADEAYDLVLSLEVVEHLKDQAATEICDLALFNQSGAACYAAEIHRMLKPGGYLVLTTPNPNSLWALLRLIEFEPPMVFRPHVREYTKAELVSLFHHFEPCAYTTFFAYFYPAEGRNMADKMAQSLGWNPEDRGDCHFFIFRKPG